MPMKRISLLTAIFALPLIGLALMGASSAPDYSLAWLPFKPMNGASAAAQLATANVAIGTSAASLTVPVGDAGNTQLELFNSGTAIAFINFGTSGVTAATTSTGYPVAPGARRIVTVDPFVTTISVIGSAANGSL